MSTVQTKPRGVHLVGSIALESADEVFRTISGVLGERLRRIPDGETGARSQWVGWQQLALGQIAELERVDALPGEAPPIKYQPRDGVDPASVDLGTLGYAEAAIESYATFARLKDEGVIRPGTRFQVSFPTPFAGTRIWVARPFREALTPSFTRAMKRAIDEIVAVVPAEELAVQWDVCLEIGYWDRPYVNFNDEDPMDDAIRADTLRTLGELGDLVPAEAELGYHLCYGDWGHAHFVQPKDAGHLVEIANGISDAAGRAVQWIHMPVPRDRDDDAYFEPLRNLKLRPETELYLGLVHITDGVDGTERRIRTAQRYVEEFGVATECGMGRRPENHSMDDLFAIHRDVSAPVS